MNEGPEERRSKRLLVLVAVVVLVIGLGVALDVHEWVSLERLRAFTTSAGPWGIAGFLLAFTVSSTAGLPALAFVLAAFAGYGLAVGVPVAFAGSLLAASTSFVTLRFARGREPLKPPARSRLIARALGTLDRRPLLTVALLRALFMLSAPLNVALALSSVRYRDYLAGSAVGLLPPLLFYAVTLECWIGTSAG